MRLKTIVLCIIFSVLFACKSNSKKNTFENELYKLHLKSNDSKDLNDLKGFKKRYQELLNNNQDYLFYYNFIEANYLFNLGDYNKSKKTYQKVLSYFNIEDENEIHYNSNRNLGYIYYEEGNYDQALKHYLKAYNKTQKEENKGFLALDIAEFYNDLTLKDEALLFLKKAQKHFILSKKNDYLKYVDLGYYILKEPKFKEVQSINSSISFLQKEKDIENLAFALLEKSKRFMQLKELDSAKWYANKSLVLATSKKINLYVFLSKLHLVKIHTTNNNYSLAKKILLNLEENISNTNLNSYLISIYNELAHIYSKEKNWQKANLYFNKKDSIFELSKHTITLKSLADIALKNNIKNKNNSLQKVTSTNNKLLFLLILLLFIFIIITQWVINRNNQKQLIIKNKLDQEQKINKARSEILANISHEIRTPLTLVIGNIQMALADNVLSKKTKKHIESALTNSKKVIDEANEILDLLKFEKHKIHIHTTTFSLHNFCKRIVLSFDSLAKIKDLQLNFFSSISPDVYIESDNKKIEKIINNLVSNAIKYSNTNQKIDVFLSQENNTFLLKVQDFGLGIPPNEKSKIFERFYQAENSKNIGGFGIGLALSKEFATLLQGNLTVESTLEKGSIFSLRLPLHKAEVLKKTTIPIVETSSQPTESNSAKKPHILIVEDNIEMNNFLVEILQEDYHCTTAFNGEEAIEKLKGTHFDLITSDIMMPKIDGFSLREQLNELKKDIPFIFISAKNLEEDKLKGFELGVNDYITKPFNTRELVARVKNLITNKNTRSFWTLKNNENFKNQDSFDNKFIQKAKKIVLANISDESFKVNNLALELGYSQRQLSRVLKQFTGMSPIKFILEVRLQKAYYLLQKKIHPTLTEVKYEIGISSTTYFNKAFKKRFGILPKEIRTRPKDSIS